MDVRTRSIGVARTRDQDVLLSRCTRPIDKSSMLAPLHHAALVLLHISRTDEVAKPNFVPGSPLHLEGEYRRLRVMVDFVRNYEMKIGNWGCLIAPLSRANLCNRCFRIPFRSMINVSPFSFFLDTSSPDVLSFLYIFHHILHHARVHASHLISEKYESLGRITFIVSLHFSLHCPPLVPDITHIRSYRFFHIFHHIVH